MVSAVLVGAAFIVATIGGIAILDRWNLIGDKRGEDSGEKRLQEQAAEQADYSLSLWQRHKTLTLPGKLVVAAGGLLVVGTLVFVYLTLRSGAPVEVPYANGMRIGAVVLGTFYVATRRQQQRAQNRGELHVVYDGEDQTADTIYFDPSNMETDANGNTILYEQRANRFLNLFPKRKLVAHDRELRTRPGALLDDQIAYQLPARAVNTTDNQFYLRAGGRKQTTGVDAPADYQFRSPEVLSREAYELMRERTQKMETRLQSEQSKRAVIEQ
jgi:hypothetical protein